jgi:lipid-binding SYLF domain-containing protein
MPDRSRFSLIGVLAVLCLGVFLFGCAGKRSASPEQDRESAHALVATAHHTLESLLKGDRGDALRELLASAAGVMIVPDMGTAGFLFSVDTGNGVLLKRKGGNWTGPVFLTEASGGFGMLAGFKHMSGIFVYTSEEDIRYVLESGGVFQGRSDITIFTSTLDLRDTPKFQEAGNVFFVGEASGLYAGTGVHGGGLMNRDYLNREYYGHGDGDPETILSKGFLAPEDGCRLRALLAEAARQGAADEKKDETGGATR